MKNYLIHYYEHNEYGRQEAIKTALIVASTLQSAVHQFSLMYHGCTAIGAEEQEQE